MNKKLVSSLPQKNCPAPLAQCGFPRNRRCEIPNVRPTQRGRRKVP